MHDHACMQVRLKLLLPCVAALATAPAFSGEPAEAPQRQLLQPPKLAVASPITDRFALRARFYMPAITTDVRYDNSAGVPGTLLSGEDTLGMEDKLKQFSIDMMFRINERHRVRADFSKTTRSGDQVIGQEVRFGNDVYQVNDRVVSSMDLRKLGVIYTWSALRSEKWELGVGLGLHLLQLDGELQVPARFEREKTDGAGPFPSLNADVTWRMTRRFSLNLAGSWLGGSVKDVKAGYQSFQGDLQFRAYPNLAFGLGYSQTRYRIDSTNADFRGYFNLKYAGPEAFVRVSF